MRYMDTVLEFTDLFNAPYAQFLRFVGFEY
jgi:hypothetical protein